MSEQMEASKTIPTPSSLHLAPEMLPSGGAAAPQTGHLDRAGPGLGRTGAAGRLCFSVIFDRNADKAEEKRAEAVEKDESDVLE